ncbi:hypothetical protein FS749_004613 [Ceratobasidium sp. UAMH 11750]|nr:hypothetical protein FS749_004613 [Ceratobasidium sp. UAMH 11750]
MSEPTPNVGMGFVYERTDSMRTGPGGLQRSATTRGKIESQSTSEDGEDGEQAMVQPVEPTPAPKTTTSPPPTPQKRTRSRSRSRSLERKKIAQ